MSARGRSLVLGGLLIAAAGPAAAHVPGELPARSPWLVWLLLLAALGWYAAGLLRLAPHVHARRELWWRAAAFVAGWTALALVLLSPLDAYATQSFAVHMVQHEVMMLVAAPLLVIGRGLPTFLWALPHDARRAVGLATQGRWLRAPWALLTSALGAWLLHAAALWLWHLPVFFNAAVTDPAVHDWQHVTFLVTALLFWHALLRHGSHPARGVAVLYLFTTTVHTGVLGALLTFAPEPLYTSFDRGLTPYFGLTPLEDQQLGGLIMWVPGALVYVGAALAIAARWIASTDPARGASPVGPGGRAM